MDPISMLKQDHDKVRDLFNRFKTYTGDTDAKWEICQDVIGEITAHATLEERIFYPAFREAGGNEEQQMVVNALREHEEITTLCDEINELSFDDPDVENKFTTLMEEVEEHANDEETEMFPKARRLLRDRFDELAEQMQQMKSQVSPTARAGRSTRTTGG